MNYSIKKKKIYKLPDDVNEGPFKIINSDNFLYSSGDEIKCINMKTGKTNFILENDDALAEPYFGLVNELKLLVKPTELKIVLYQIDKSLIKYQKIKELKIKGFQIARSLSNGGYIIGCEKKILIYNSKDELEFSLDTQFNFFGFDYQITPPFELKIKKNEKKNLLILPMGNDTNIYLRNDFKKVMNINSTINDALDMKDGNIILASEEKLILVNIKTYKNEYEVECPQIEEDLKYLSPHSFRDIFEYKDNIFISISGYSNQSDNSFLLSVWNYNLNKINKIEKVQCLKFDDYALMLDKSNLLIMEYDGPIIQLSIKEIKGKSKDIVKTTTESEFNKNKKKKKTK